MHSFNYFFFEVVRARVKDKALRLLAYAVADAVADAQHMTYVYEYSYAEVLFFF
jgi:hypothetical protein